METKTIHLRDLREEILTEILVRLPLRSNARFKTVSKTWKLTIESVYFRRLYVSLHQKSSPSWSLMSYGYELVGFHGCKIWELRKSLSFFIPPSLRVMKASSNGLILISGYDRDCVFVGNPVLQQWIKIPPSPSKSSVFGLVTRVDDDGFLLGFKVVRLAKMQVTDDYLSCVLSVFLYSSETGIWSSKIIQCPYQISNPTSFTLNDTIYYSHISEPGVLVAYDFYSESSDQFRVISAPDQPNDIYKSSFTTSGGFVMYIRASSQNVVKVWRLNNDDTWQLLWNISLPVLIAEYEPMAMHPFDSDIIYLWSQENRHVVSCNLRTQKNRILGDAGNDDDDDDDDDQQDCFVNKPICEKSMDGICDFDTYSVALSQLVLPRWMESVPCPPQAEMIDQTSLLSYVASMDKQMWRDGVGADAWGQW